MDLRFVSYNMHGWNNGLSYLQQLEKQHDIMFLCEHWLLPQNLDVLLNFNTEFAAHAVSGITDFDAFACKGGRPYGGLGVLWRKS